MRAWGAGIVLGVSIASQAIAGSFEIAPTTIDISDGQAALLYVTNRGADPVAGQIEAFDWTQDEGGADRLVASATLEVSPPMAELAPGSRQTVRVLAPENATPKERAYRLTVSELPSVQAQGANAVRVLLQFSIPVFAGGSGEPVLEWSAARDGDRLVVTVHNSGNRHAKLAGIDLTMPGGKQVAVAPDSFAYVLGGASHRWTVENVHVRDGETIALTATDQRDNSRVSASIAVGR